jgi:hypothetical protein
MEFGQYEIKGVDLAVAVPVDDENGGDQSNRCSAAEQPKICSA